MRLPVTIATCFVALIGGGLLAACDGEPEKAKAEVVRPVRAMKISDAAGFKRRKFSGRAKATKELDLAFNISGQVTQLKVKVGDEIKEGDLVSQLDPATFKAEVAKARASLRRTQATLKNAREQVKRDEKLFKKGHVSQARLDKAIAKRDEASADVASAKASHDRAGLDLKYTNLKAPFAGIVVQTYIDNFENIRAKQPVIRLIDSSRIEMVVDIPESLISYVPQAGAIAVVFDTFPDIEIAAKIKEIGSEASATTRTYPVTLIMEQPEGAKILPGMAGRAFGKGDPPAALKAQGGFEVPPAAVFTETDSDKSYVWVINEAEKKVEKREVVRGGLTARGLQIKSGIKAGEWLVTAGVNFLKQGQTVRILEQ